jgi:hypothetical protein
VFSVRRLTVIESGMAARAIEDLAGGELLDEVARLHQVREEASAKILVAATELALQHGEGRFDLDLVNQGRERFVRFGGAGTPKVAEFAPALLGARLQLSPYAAGRLMADALDLRYRHPLLWGRTQRLEVRESFARFVARRTRDLTVEQARFVDERVAESADGRLPWSRFETLVEASIVQADPAVAQAREEAAAKEQFAKPTHSDEHGIRGFYIRADFATIARLDATVAYIADALEALGDEGTLDERRVKAVLILANPTRAVELLQAYAEWRHKDDRSSETPSTRPPAVPNDSNLLPAVWLFVHTGGSGAARVEGMSPVTEGWVREHLGERCRFKITEVIDPLVQVPVDSYEIPERHRQAVHLMTPADIFPFAASTSRAQQIDHTREYARGGPSAIGNYGPMVTFHHRIKTHSGWQVEQPFPGIYLWRDPHGAFYLVDHTGTRRLRAA